MTTGCVSSSPGDLRCVRWLLGGILTLPPEVPSIQSQGMREACVRFHGGLLVGGLHLSRQVPFLFLPTTLLSFSIFRLTRHS